MRREIPGVDALAKAFPSEWLLYVSLNCYPKNQAPMEIDALVVLDDRALVLEIKDWNGKLTQDGDRWYVNGASRGRSAVIMVEEKAKKFKAIIRSEIPQLTNLWVDFRVILTATSTSKHLPTDQQKYVWRLQEACSISNPAKKAELLGNKPLGLMKAYQFEREFERVTGNPKLFQASEADWDGYRVVEQDIFVHPREVWREHRAERKGEPRLKALLRIWAFDRLPPGLNSPDRRKLVAQREMKAYAHLTSLGSSLIENNGILREIGSNSKEILTEHFELRSLLPDWLTLDRYLEKTRDDLDVGSRILIATALLSLISELHKAGIAHRDIGQRCIWVGSPTKMALSGLMACQLPEEESVADWLSTLCGYAPVLAHDNVGDLAGTGRQRDVLCAGRLVGEILSDATFPAHGQDFAPQLPSELSHLADWLRRSRSPSPEERYPDVIVMAEEFGRLAEKFGAIEIDQSLLDGYETSTVPYVKWAQSRILSSDSKRTLYVSLGSNREEYVVKVWNGLLRGLNSATDLALIRLIQGVSRVVATPIQGLPRFIEVAISPVGPYVVYRHEAGTPLDQVAGLPSEVLLLVASKLLSCVTALHELGCDHGDIAPKNIIYDSPTNSICILDAFDISPIGSGSVRTPSYCPANWESLSRQALDRYAVLRIVFNLLHSANDVRLAPVIALIDAELKRPSIDTLDVAQAEISRISNRLRQPPIPEFIVYWKDARDRFFRADDDLYFIHHRRISPESAEYYLTASDAELAFRARNGVMRTWRFSKTTFGALSYASRQGIGVRMKISVLRGADQGYSPLYEFIKTKVDSAGETFAVAPTQTPPSFDVARHWRKLMDLESEDRIEIEIVDQIGTREETRVYEFKNRGRNFDFDPEDLVDVYIPPNKRAGEVDHRLTDSTSTIGIRDSNRYFSAGDVLYLADRREQTSIDRRAKAIRRILDRQSAVPDLIDYFSPKAAMSPTDFGMEISDAELEQYGLNEGQKESFRSLLRYGPVGLLQGPPGTGKTRFIASFVHWLVTKASAHKILITSQSHEAVNNVIEILITLYKRLGGRPNLLRIGSKGMTERIRPYHTSELRDRYRLRFDGAFKYRVSLLASARGVSRDLTADVVDLEQEFGMLARRCFQLRKLAEDVENRNAVERERYANQLRRGENALQAAGHRILGRTIDISRPLEELDQAYVTLLTKHKKASPADLSLVRSTVELSRDWLSSMASPHRNFEEFLAKTRTIVTATCVGVGQTRIRIDSNTFDWAIVDEAARCTPGELAVPIQLGRRVLLVGDHLQLMPMIKREHIEQLGEVEDREISRDELLRSDFERAFTSSYGQGIGKTLTEQYRMTPAICALVSECFYEPNHVRLETSRDIASHSELESHFPPSLSSPICWIDTSKEPKHNEVQPANSYTFFNEAEATAVIKVLERISEQQELVNALMSREEESPIGVICMYSGQKDKIEMAFARHGWEPRFRRLVRIDTVDSYQGKENAIVIVSVVRSNPSHVPGHVSSDNRCNVAVSRAKERLILVGSSSMWRGSGKNLPMRRIMEFIDKHASTSRIVLAGDL